MPPMLIPRKIILGLVFLPFFFISSFPISFAAVPEVQAYSDLLRALRGVHAAAEARVELAVTQAKVQEAWEMGDLISRHILLNKDRADYGDFVLQKLGEDMGVSRSELYRYSLFAKLYPVMPVGLTWSHYRFLISVKDDAERKKIEDEAAREHWTKRKLDEQIRLRKLTASAIDEVPLEPQRGKLNTYQVINEDKHLKIDLGFSSFKELPPVEGKAKMKQGDIVRVEKWKIEPAPDRTTLDLYTYSATVYEVTDGDTFWAVVDLGFGFTTKQKLRLRGIDAPELPTEEGLEAKAFVQERLKSGQKIIICSTRSDKYDRYLADVYYTAKDGEHFLNNELLENRLALRA